MADDEKPKFSDVLGALVAGVAQARNIADQEAVRTAQRYRNNELMRDLPVPRLRFRQISIELPFVLEELLPRRGAVPNKAETVAERVMQAMQESLRRSLAWLRSYHEAPLKSEDKERAEDSMRLIEHLLYGKEGVRVSAELREKQQELTNLIKAGAAGSAKETVDLEKAIKKLADDYATQGKRTNGHLHGKLELGIRRTIDDVERDRIGAHISDATLSESIGDTVEEELREHIASVVYRMEQDRLEEKQKIDSTAALSFEGADRAVARAWANKQIVTMMRATRRAAQHAAASEPSQSADFRVSVTTDEIQTSGGPGAVTRLRIVLFEEGLEWIKEGTGDNSRDILTKE